MMTLILACTAIILIALTLVATAIAIAALRIFYKEFFKED